MGAETTDGSKGVASFEWTRRGVEFADVKGPWVRGGDDVRS
jgi:hypothetical protein